MFNFLLVVMIFYFPFSNNLVYILKQLKLVVRAYDLWHLTAILVILLISLI